MHACMHALQMSTQCSFWHPGYSHSAGGEDHAFMGFAAPRGPWVIQSAVCPFAAAARWRPLPAGAPAGICLALHVPPTSSASFVCLSEAKLRRMRQLCRESSTESDTIASSGSLHRLRGLLRVDGSILACRSTAGGDVKALPSQRSSPARMSAQRCRDEPIGQFGLKL
jgi:hypothetical protein